MKKIKKFYVVLHGIPNIFSDSYEATSFWNLLVNQVCNFTAKHYWLAIGTFFGFCLRAKNLAAGIWERHCLSHYWLVGTFFLSHVVSVTTDIVSDIILANQHFQRGQVNWGLATLGFVAVSCSKFDRQVVTLVSQYCAY